MTPSCINVMLNLFQYPSILVHMAVAKAPWTLKQVQGDGFILDHAK